MLFFVLAPRNQEVDTKVITKIDTLRMDTTIYKWKKGKDILKYTIIYDTISINTIVDTSAILKDFFEYYLIPSRVVVSKFAKDAAEHYFQKTRNLSDFIEIDITDEMIISTNDDKFDFLKHLKNRTF